VRKGKYRDTLAEEAARQLAETTRYIPPQPKDPSLALRAAEYAAVRLNTAAVLREDALLRKKQEEESALIRRYESELRDDSEFYEWQAKMRQADEMKRLEEVTLPAHALFCGCTMWFCECIDGDVGMRGCECRAQNQDSSC
jgi:hypothetical protein